MTGHSFLDALRTAAKRADVAKADLPQTLGEYSYLAARGQPFWNLFEQCIPELPLVEG